MPRKQAQRVVPEMLAAFERDLTEPVMERLLSFAKRRVAMLAKVGVRRTADDARAMVQDAITDTLTRVVTWDPQRVTLEKHLRLVIRTRSLNRLKQVRRVPLKSMEDSQDGELTVARVAEATRMSPTESVEMGEVAEEVVAEVVERAKEVPQVLALIEAYQAGCQERAEVIEHTGMNVQEFVNARRRLDRLLAALPDQMHNDVEDALRRNV
jgi:hypothetical protein